MRELAALILTVAVAITPACKRAATAPGTEPTGSPADATMNAPTTAPTSVPPPIPTPPTMDPAPGEVGPLGSDCYDTKQAKACPLDPSDPSGKKLVAYGGPCHFPVCRPCGSETALSFRDEHGKPSAGYCICVPTSDSSGRGSLTCYSPQAWKSRSK